jgi:hypothetical protein
MTDDDCERITEVDLRPAFADDGLEPCPECGTLDELRYRDDWDGGLCECCAEKRIAAEWAEGMAESAWMMPHIERANAARRSGDFEEAERIKNDVLRYDSPFDPHAIRRRA